MIIKSKMLFLSKKNGFIFIFLILLKTSFVFASNEEIGINYFFPLYEDQVGPLSQSIAPLSFEAPFDITSFFNLTPTLNLMSIGGLNFKGNPIFNKTKDPMLKAHQSLLLGLIPELKLRFSKSFQIKIGVGGFLFYNLGMPLSRNIDNAFRSALDFESLTTFDLKIKASPLSHLGYGLTYRLLLSPKLSKNTSFNLGVEYLRGESFPFELRGTYSGIKKGSSTIITRESIKSIDGLQNTKVDFTGFKLLISVSFFVFS